MTRPARARMWEYRVTMPILPPGATSPVMDYRQMEQWLGDMDAGGWELVTYGATHWHNMNKPQEWWVFRRRIAPVDVIERGPARRSTGRRK